MNLILLVPRKKDVYSINDMSSGKFVVGNRQVLAHGTNSIITKALFKNKYIVIKELKEKCRSQNIAVHEMNMEVQALRCFDHPNIIDIIGHGEDCILLEYLPGGTLQDYFQKEYNKQKHFLFHGIHCYFGTKKCEQAYLFEKVRQTLLIAIAFAAGMKYLHEDVDPKVCFIHRGSINQIVLFS